MGWTAKNKAEEVTLPTLQELELHYMQEVLNFMGGVIESAKVLGISRRCLSDKMRIHGMKLPKKATEKADLLSQIRGMVMNKDVSYSVTPEERDYYYNLDFLRGRYSDITHALGKGEEE